MKSNHLKQYSFVDAFKIIMANWTRASIMQGAAEMAYYLLLSLVPILLVIANVIPLLPIDTTEILGVLEQSIPADVTQFIMPIVTDYLDSGSGGAISIGLLASIWSASNVFSTLSRVLDEVYGTSERKNFIISRLLSLAVMLFILGIVTAVVFIFLFGEQILGFVSGLFDVEFPLFQHIIQLRWIALPLVLFSVGLIIYDLVPNHHLSLRYALPGSTFLTIGLLLLSEFFSLITQFMGGEAIANQTIGSFIALMLFLYFSNMIILLGALLNTVYFELKNGQTVLSYEKSWTEKEKLEESGWSGYPDEEHTVILKRKIFKVN